MSCMKLIISILCTKYVMFISCTKLIMLKTPSTHSKSTMMSPCSKEIKQQHLNPILFPYLQHCIYTQPPSGSILFAYCYHNNFCNILHCWWKISVWGENLQKMVVKLVSLEAPLLLPVHMIFKQRCQEWWKQWDDLQIIPRFLSQKFLRKPSLILCRDWPRLFLYILAWWETASNKKTHTMGSIWNRQVVYEEEI